MSQNNGPQNNGSQNKGRDSIGQTLLVATALCVFCSVLVAGAAVGLRDKQEANKLQDQKKNVLLAAGLFDEKEQDASEVNAIFETSIVQELIDLQTGQPVDPALVDPKTYEQREASRNPELSTPIESSNELGGIKKREKYSFIYRVQGESGETEMVVLPIYGKGLWSTVYGFIAINVDANTIEGITFYEHGETPGLGAEIENPKWRELWKGKQLFGKDGEIEIKVIKGAVNPDSGNAKFQVDGLSGATITGAGVSQLVRYWMGPHGFGPYLDIIRQSATGDANG